MLPETTIITLKVVRVFERLGIPYFVGGSMASSVYGFVRITRDAALIADIKLEHLEPMAQYLEGEFYVDRHLITESIQRRSSFPLIHLETMFKVDIFLIGDQPYDRKEMARRQQKPIHWDSNELAYISSPEDIILAKLRWYLLSPQANEQQWRDITGLIHTQLSKLDMRYIHHWAKILRVEALLAKALREAD
jgi:hypothetical protein